MSSRDLNVRSNARRPARRALEIEPFHVMALLARAKELEAEGRSVVHMEVGEPDFPTPDPVRRAAMRFLERGEVFYTPALGLPELRRAISEFYRGRYRADVAPERIVVTTGASAALTLACAALIDPGDEVLIADPGYPCDRHFVRLFEGIPVPLPVAAQADYQLDPGLVERRWRERTRAAIVATPANPTGAVLAAERLSAMAECIRAAGGTLIVDEIYHGLIYDEGHTSAVACADDVFVVNSFSKYFNMTGWRLGWLVVPERYLAAVEKLAQNVYIAPPTLAQQAALAAFEPETIAVLEARRAEFRARRDYLVPALRALGFDIPVVPRGAFYIYAGCAAVTEDSFRFARELLEQAGVAITPGIDFGANAPERHVRFAYTNSVERLREGVSRLAAFLRGK